jgi:predicted HAD superfamily phosphohydrolase
MGATSDDLMEIARAGAERIDLPGEQIRYPSFVDIEDQCAAEYDELLNALRDDELFAPADLQRQEEIVERLKSVVGETHEALLEELVDNTARQLWLNQEAAFHLGMAVGLRLAQGRRH